jgi:hypothetical protein
MNDVKVIAIKDSLPIVSAQIVPNLIPRTVDIRGQRFSSASEVLINHITAPEFMVLSDSRILAQIPDGQTLVRTIVVLAEHPSTNNSVLFQFEVGRTFKKITGIERLIQMFTKIVLQTPGTDKFRPDIGGGLIAIAGQNVGTESGTSLSASAVSAISRARDQVIALQNKTLRTPPDERLLTADVLGVGFDANSTTLAIRVGITAQSGRTAVTNLTF